MGQTKNSKYKQIDVSFKCYLSFSSVPITLIVVKVSVFIIILFSLTYLMHYKQAVSFNIKHECTKNAAFPVPARLPQTYQ